MLLLGQNSIFEPFQILLNNKSQGIILDFSLGWKGDDYNTENMMYFIPSSCFWKHHFILNLFEQDFNEKKENLRAIN